MQVNSKRSRGPLNWAPWKVDFLFLSIFLLLPVVDTHDKVLKSAIRLCTELKKHISIPCLDWTRAAMNKRRVTPANFKYKTKLFLNKQKIERL